MLKVFPHTCLLFQGPTLFHLSVIFHLYLTSVFPLSPPSLSIYPQPSSVSAALLTSLFPLFLSFFTDPVLPVPSWPLSPHVMLHSFRISATTFSSMLFPLPSHVDFPSMLLYPSSFSLPSHVDFPPAVAVSRDKMTGVSPGTCVTNGNSMLLSCAGR